MTAVTSRPRRARATTPPDRARRGQRRQLGRDSGGNREPIDLDAQRGVVLRCPGPLVALRGLAALYRVSAQRLAALLPACEAVARSEADPMPGALRRAVSDAVGAPPRTPVAVHYFHAAWLRDPRLVLEQGLRPSPTTPDAVWQRLGDLVSGDIPSHALYCAHDHLALPALVQDLTVACRSDLGFDIDERFAHATTPCIVEYRRCAARDGRDIDAALWFVAAALRGAVSPLAVGGHNARGTPIAAHDIVSVRAIESQTEWTHRHRP